MSVVLTSVSAEEGQVISINGTDTKFIEKMVIDSINLSVIFSEQH